MDALKTATDNASPGDVIVLFYENFDKSYEFIQKLINEPFQEIPIFTDVNSPDLSIEYFQ